MVSINKNHFQWIGKGDRASYSGEGGQQNDGRCTRRPEIMIPKRKKAGNRLFAA